MANSWQQMMQMACGDAGYLLVHVARERFPWSADAPTCEVRVSGGGRCLVVCDHVLPQQLLATFCGVKRMSDAVGEPNSALVEFSERLAAAAEQCARGDAGDWSVRPGQVQPLQKFGGETALDTATQRVTVETDDGLRCEIAWWDAY